MTINDIFEKVLDNKAKIDAGKLLNDSLIYNAVLVQKVMTKALTEANKADHINKTTIGNPAEELALIAHRTRLIELMAYSMTAIERTNDEIFRVRKRRKQ